MDQFITTITVNFPNAIITYSLTKPEKKGRWTDEEEALFLAASKKHKKSSRGAKCILQPSKKPM